MPRQDQRQLFAEGAADSLPTEIANRPRRARSWPVLASIALHGLVFFLILLGDASAPVGAVGTGGGILPVFEVVLVSLKRGSGENAPPQAQDMLTDPPQEQKRQPEAASMPEDATPLRVERPQKSRQQATRALRKEQPQRPQQTTVVSGTQGENGLGSLATPGDAAGSGRPFGFSLGEVSGKPKVVKSVPVVYPMEARKKGITGQVLVRFHLDENGTVSHLHIKYAQPPDIFNQNALASLRQWRFQPANHNRKAVPVWVELPVEFALRQ